jgi:predicted dehydrogenase
LLPEIDYKASGDLSVAVIGFGKMGILHSGILNLLVPGCVKWVVDRSRLLVFGASRMLRGVRFYSSLGRLLGKEEPDLVYVTTPTGSHCSIIKQLIEYSVPYVFVEKPPTRDLEELNSLLNTGGQVMVGMQKRFTMPFRHAKQLLEDEAVGEIRNVLAMNKSSDIMEPTTRYDSLGRGVLLDLGIHLVDTLNWVLGVEKVSSAEAKSIHTGVDDEFTATLLGDGFEAYLDVSWSSPMYRLPEINIKIEGTEGSLELSEGYLKLEAEENLEYYKPDYYQGTPPVNLADPEYTLESMHLLHCMENGSEPITSIREIGGTMALIDEMYEASSSG